MAAATAMLDSIHQRLSGRGNDSNAYTLGNIGEQNIVMACIPSRTYGTINAVIVTSDMRQSFAAIQTRLMDFERTRGSSTSAVISFSFKARRDKIAISLEAMHISLIDQLLHQFPDPRSLLALPEFDPWLREPDRSWDVESLRNMDDPRLCMQWLLYARRPMSCQEFYLVVV